MLVAILLSTSSCYVTRTHIGEYRQETNNKRANSQLYDKSKQCWLFWGMIPLGKVTTKLPQNQCYEVRTHFGFGDFLVSGITGGLFSMQTVKVRIPKIKDMEQIEGKSNIKQTSTNNELIPEGEIEIE